ncbi:MAG: GGDEF domain-containing protein [Acidobacteriota bacterium]
MVGQLTAAAILSALPDAVIVTDSAGRVLSVNPAAERGAGWKHAEMVGIDVSQVLRRERRRALGLSRHLAGQAQPYQLLPRTGPARAVEVCESVLRDERGQFAGRIYVCRDVGEALALSNAMAHGALHDPLTGLPNRRCLMGRLQQALAAAGPTKTPVAVCFLDVDGMKTVNDQLGHETGDLLLQSVATRLVSCVRAADTVARIGGDEFVVILHRLAHTDDAAAVERSLADGLHRPHDIGPHTLQVSASMGWAFSPRDSHDPNALLSAADRAMYVAKRARAGASAGR